MKIEIREIEIIAEHSGSGDAPGALRLDLQEPGLTDAMRREIREICREMVRDMIARRGEK